MERRLFGSRVLEELFTVFGNERKMVHVQKDEEENEEETQKKQSAKEEDQFCWYQKPNYEVQDSSELKIK